MSRITSEEFFEKYYTRVVLNSHEWTKLNNIFENIQDAFAGFDATKAYSKDEIKSIFNPETNSRVSFVTQKTIALRIMESENWNNETVCNLQSVDYFDICKIPECELDYWGSVESLFDAIDYVGVLSGNNVWYQKAAAGLLWHGIKMSDMLDIEIQNINLMTNQITVKDSVYNIGSETMAAVIAHKNERRCSSQYLFIGHHGARASESTIRKNMTWMNKYQNETSKVFDGRKILLSGMFDRIYRGVEDEPKYQKDVMYKYTKWKEVYRSN